MRSAEDTITLAILLAGAPLTLSELADKTGMRKQNVAYWLPRMVDKGTLLRLEVGGCVRYQPQPILLCEWIQEVLGELYTEAVERHEEFFVFDQTERTRAEVIVACISQSLRMFCRDIRLLSK